MVLYCFLHYLVFKYVCSKINFIHGTMFFYHVLYLVSASPLKAPMGLFYSATFGIVGQKMTALQHRSQGDSEDPHNEHYLLATQNRQDQVRKYIRPQNLIYSHRRLLVILTLCKFLQQSSKSAADRKAVSRPGGCLEGEVSCQGRMGDMSDMPRGCGSGAGPTAGGGGVMHSDMELGPAQGESLMEAGEVEELLSTHVSRKTAIISQFESKALGLDKAILHSIDCCGKEVNGDMKQKQYSTTRTQVLRYGQQNRNKSVPPLHF